MNPVKTPAWQCCYLKQVIRPISSLSNKRDVQNMSPLHKRTQTQVNKYTHPFILHPQFLQFLEIWFEKSGSINLFGEIWFQKSDSANSDFFSGSRKVEDQKKRWVYTIRPPFFRLKKSGSATRFFFLVRGKRFTRKKNPSLQNHFSTLF